MKTNKQNLPINILITGGSGFLGRRIIAELISSDSLFPAGKIRVLDISPLTGADHERVEYVPGDIRNTDALERACEGIQIVMHCAAVIDWGTKSEEEVMEVNLKGTENVIEACRKQGVEYLVYTSSLDAVFTGKPLVDIDETQAYPVNSKTIYCKSKKEAEKRVLKAGDESLKVSILRPSDIYGEADPYHIDSLIDMANKGFYVRLGNGKARCQHVYVGNMAHAHVQLASALYNGNEKVADQIYFITDGEGSNFFRFFDQIVSGAGYKIFPKNLWLPKGLAYTIGWLSEVFAIAIRPIKKVYPKFSRFAVVYTCTDFTFSSRKAKVDFDYKLKYSTEEAMKRTIAYYTSEIV